MLRNFSRATFAFSLTSLLLFSCQKDLKETSSSLTVQQDAKITQPSEKTLLTDGLGVSLGSTIGPGGDLYVPNGSTGSITRVDAGTGQHSTFASGLPPLLAGVGIGGVTDVAFIGNTAYALVTIVDDPTLFPTGAVNGIYRIDDATHATVVADIGAFNLAHPPVGIDFFISTGVLYSLHPYRGGFLVTDGHLNRVLHVKLDGAIEIVRSFGDIVPTGLEVKGNQVLMAEAGPVPHLPQNGKIISFSSKSSSITDIASGAPLLVDVEYGRGQTLFGLSQGDGSGGPDGSPALPNTGSLVRVNDNGSFTIVSDELNQPTSLEIAGNTAYIITLNGEIWTVDNIAGPPFGKAH